MYVGRRRTVRLGLDTNAVWVDAGQMMTTRTPRAYALARREAHAPRRGGACVTTLLEMPFGAQRQNFCDAMRDLVVSPAMGVSTLEPGVVWTRE